VIYIKYKKIGEKVMTIYNDSYEETAWLCDFSEENLENELFCKSFEKSED
jgi:hypothetical protein